MIRKVSNMNKTKAELEAENNLLQQNTMLLMNDNRVLQSRLNECNGLINHYELTIALLIGRLKEEQKALSSHASSDLRTQAGDSLGQSKQK